MGNSIGDGMSDGTEKQGQNGEGCFQLQMTHAVILIGIVFGGLVASFFLGYRSGKLEKFTELTAGALKQAPRMPIPGSEKPQQVSERLVSEVYAKLQDGPSVVPDLERVHGDSLGIPVDAAPLKPSKTIPIRTESSETLEALANRKALKKTVGVKKTSKEKKKPVHKGRSQKTLGGIFELANSQKAKREEKQVQVVRRSPIISSVSKKKKEEIPPPAPNKLQTTFSPGWYIQLAALKSKTDANILIAKLSANGFRDSGVQIATVKGSKYYRVLVGPEETSLLAQRLRDQLVREPYIKFKPYLRRVQ